MRLPASIGHDRLGVWLPILCCAGVFSLYLPALQNGFVNFDDGGYITNNPMVRQGVTWEGIRWAFTRFHMANWHPLTWLSHMADVSLFGMNPAGHHLTSVLMHTLNTALVFASSQRLTASPWSAALVALLFGLHPLHVESVAWASERKDLLGACFGFVSLIAYLKYAATESRFWFGAAVAGHAMSLLAKPMAVTLPVILVLLDIGPLQRWPRSPDFKRISARTIRLSGIIAEKFPFAALSLAVSIVTFLAQTQKGAVIPLEKLDLSYRLKNAVISYWVYLKQTVFPADLAIYYPLEPIHWMSAALAASGLILLTFWVMVGWRQHRLIAFGWFWYLITLLPVIGIVQVGLQAHADRYTYIPLFGVFLAFAEACRIWGERRPLVNRILLSGFIVAFIALGWLTVRQLKVWENSVTLFNNAVGATRINPLAHTNLGGALASANRTEEAIEQFRTATKISPNNPIFQANLGQALLMAGKHEEAIEPLARALSVPHSKQKQTRLAMATVMILLGHTDRGLEYYSKATGHSPDSIEALKFMGETYIRKKRYDEAVLQFEKARRLEPSHSDIAYRLGLALAGAGRYSEAVKHLEESLVLKPDAPEARKALDTVAPLAAPPRTP